MKDFEGVEILTEDDELDALAITEVCIRIFLNLSNT